MDTPSATSGHPLGHDQDPKTTKTRTTTGAGAREPVGSLGDNPGPVALRRVWEIFQSVTGLDAGRAFAREEQRCLEVYRWGVARQGDDWLPEVRRAVEAFSRADRRRMKSPWAVFAASPGRWLEAELDRPLTRGPLPARTEFDDAEDVNLQIDRQLGVAE